MRFTETSQFNHQGPSMNELPPPDKPYTCEGVMKRLRDGNDMYCRRLKAKTTTFTEKDYLLPTEARALCCHSQLCRFTCDSRARFLGG